MKYTDDFDIARKAWPGVKRGCETEIKCLKKHKDWLKVIPLLLPAIEEQIRRHRLKKQLNVFVPPWKHFQTWLNNRCWEEEEQLAISKPSQLSMKEYCERRKERERKEQQGYLESKTTAALLDLKADRKALVAHWLIDEILNERNRQIDKLRRN